MIRPILLILCACSVAALGQPVVPAPIYKVTVEQRSIEAVNYGHANEPTKIDFRGTVLLPRAKGEAKIEGKAGAVDIDARFKGLQPPTQFGPRYLTYVLWAITPEGRPVNLGEVLPDASNDAKLKVTARLQAFGLLVTAEPYFSVTEPSNVVVLENEVRPDTEGKVEEVQAKFELLRRDESPVTAGPIERQRLSNEERAVPMDRYQALLALYEAQNALQIARAQGADHYAQNTMKKAESLYAQAEKLGDEKDASQSVVTIAREATQTAEDARTIAATRASEPRFSEPPPAETR